MTPDLFWPALIGGAAALVAITLVALRRGPRACERCGGRLPALRLPGTADHARSGGWTCPHCGAELDHNGRVIGD